MTWVGLLASCRAEHRSTVASWLHSAIMEHLFKLEAQTPTSILGPCQGLISSGVRLHEFTVTVTGDSDNEGGQW